MASIRERAFQDILAKANAGLSESDQFERSRTWPVPSEVMPKRIAYAFEPPGPMGLGDEVLGSVGVGVGGQQRRAAWAAFEIVFNGDGTTTPDEAVDSLLVDVAKKIVGQKVAQLYMLVEDMGIIVRRAQADYPYCRATQYVRIHYLQRTTDPEQWA